MSITPQGRAKFCAGALAAVLLLPGSAAAQTGDAASCPEAGVTLAADSASRRLVRDAAKSRTTLDTTFHFAVERKRWTDEDVAASVAAGVVGMEHARWRACAGAWVQMRRVDMVIEGASGTVHLRSSVAALLQRLRAEPLQPADNPRREDT